MRRLRFLSVASIVIVGSAFAAGPDPLDSSLFPNTDAEQGSVPANVWVTGPLAKILQDAGSPGAGKTAVVYAVPNEIQSFQVHIKAPSAGIAALSVSMSDLVNSQTGTHISAASTDIVVYIERYMNVTIKTATGATFLNTTGHIPDILVPAVDPYYHQTTNAFPAVVQPHQNQSVWVDVHVPVNAPSGYYKGFVTLRNGAAVLAKVPVVYAIWSWPSPGSMPSTATLRTWQGQGYGGMCFQWYGCKDCCNPYPGSGGSSDQGITAAQVDTAVQLLDNRLSNAGAVNVFPESGSFANYDSWYGPLLNGTDAHVPGILKGAKLTDRQIVSLSGFSPPVYQNFVDHWSLEGWSASSPLLDYLCDEPPNGCTWDQLIAWGTAEHMASNPIIPNLVTTDYYAAQANGALDVIDWLTPALVVLEPLGGPLQNLQVYADWIALEPAIRQWWSYGACSNAGTCSNGTVGPPQFTYPNYDVDGTPVANRAMEWLTYLHGNTGELYYCIDCCSYVSSTECGVYPGGPVTSPLNPIVSNYDFGGWGDGTLVYYGSSQYVGTPIPLVLPSMRLKMFRDGVQDYEYCHELALLGQDTFVRQQIATWMTNSYTFNNDPAGLTAARRALGAKIHQLSLGF